MFQTSKQPSPAPPSTPPSLLDLALTVDTQTSNIPRASDCQVPSIKFVSHAAFVKACQLEGSVSFSLSTLPWDSELHAASTHSDPVNLSDVPKEYHEFADMFSKSKAYMLAPHREHDLKIDLEEGTSPPLGTMYSLSPSELEALRAFLDEHLASGFIRPTTSSHVAPVLFICKKDGSLCLCIDFQGLNKITKKDRYPLPRISDLLDVPSHAKFYTK